jgi:hypothetical protein
MSYFQTTHPDQWHLCHTPHCYTKFYFSTYDIFIRIQFGEELAFTELNTNQNKDKFAACLLKFTQL